MSENKLSEDSAILIYCVAAMCAAAVLGTIVVEGECAFEAYEKAHACSGSLSGSMPITVGGDAWTTLGVDVTTTVTSIHVKDGGP